MTAPRNLDAGAIVRGPGNRPIGAVIIGANGRFAGWNRDGKLGEFDTESDAVNAIRKAHFVRNREGEKR